MTGNIIGVFILGILTGWLIEWLFVTFIMAKSKPQTMSDPMTTDGGNNEALSVVDNVISPQTDTVEENKSIKPDDFMRLKGIGPKLAESIKDTKINRYEELAAFTGEELIAKLEASGAIIVNRPAFSHIPKQAALAAKGDWEALDILKKSI